jgi:curved DNA-binding protein CbpA
LIDYYQLLGIHSSADPEEIKKAYKRKAVHFHPDKNPETEELFKEINAAYQTLSDPYARARYDLKLKYGEAQFTEPNRDRPPPAARGFYRRSNYQRPEYHKQVLSKANLRATLFAFIFAVGMGSVVMLAVQINSWYQEQAYADQMAQRRTTYELARVAFKESKYSKAIILLSGLGSLRAGEDDIDEYKAKMIDDIYNEGLVYFRTQKYDLALANFALVEGFSKTRTVQHQKIMAEAYLGIGQTERALQQLKDILDNGLRDVDLLVRIADIFTDRLNDYSKALTYYEWGNRIAMNDYEAIYGAAYPLLINARVIPQKHYELYCGLAKSYYQTGEYQKAINATKWSVQIWPDSTFNYLVMAESALALDKMDLACENFQIAKALDESLELPDSCD